MVYFSANHAERQEFIIPGIAVFTCDFIAFLPGHDSRSIRLERHVPRM